MSNLSVNTKGVFGTGYRLHGTSFRKVGEIGMILEYIIKIDEDKKDIMGNYPLKDKPHELVRCKDCKKCDLPEEEPYENGYCSRCGYVTMDWFCADGEGRDGP